MKLEEFRKEFLDEIRLDALINATDPESEFISKTFEILNDIGEIEEPIQHYFGKKFRGNRIMQVDGYSFDSVDSSLSLIICDFEDKYEPNDMNRERIEDVLAKRLRNFLENAYEGILEDYCDESDDTIKIANQIKYKMTKPETDILKIKLYIITNKKLSDKVKKLKQTMFMERPVEINIWHIERFFDLENTLKNEPVVVDIKNDFNFKGIACLKADIGDNLDYYAYTAIIPGKLLADIYIEYGSKILEGNVRAFLGASGSKSVNSGIKRTIMNEPNKFFSYNNGIAVTAASVEVEELIGETLITKIEDMQIINGGQTTASLAAAILKKDNLELEGIYVPMKITIIEDRDAVNEEGSRFYDMMVQNISKYANSQNKVTAADFFSNSPYHVIIEKLSKKYFAPPVKGELNQTGWYYERARKKYEQEQIKMTPSEKEKFLRKYPKKQILTKEKLAKYLYCVECKPHIVSRGSNWVMKDFANFIDAEYAKNKNVFNEYYFKKCVGSAIIFQTVDSMVVKADWYIKGGYKLNVVPYTIAKIINSIPSDLSIDWQRIWQNQYLYPSFVKEIEVVSKMTNDFINKSGGVIVTEYCKKEETWKKYKEEAYEPSNVFVNDLVSKDVVRAQEWEAKKEQKSINDISEEISVINKGEAYWKKFLDEAEYMGIMGYKEKSLLNIAANFEKTGKIPTTAQAKSILKIEKNFEDRGLVIRVDVE